MTKLTITTTALAIVLGASLSACHDYNSSHEESFGPKQAYFDETKSDKVVEPPVVNDRVEQKESTAKNP